MLARKNTFGERVITEKKRSGIEVIHEVDKMCEAQKGIHDEPSVFSCLHEVDIEQKSAYSIALSKMEENYDYN